MRHLSRVTPVNPRLKRVAWLGGFFGCAAVAIAFSALLLSGFAQSPSSENAPASPQAPAASSNPQPQPPPAAASVRKDAPPAEKAAIDPQKQELANQCAQLLKMAATLKNEVDKTTQDTLSISVVRKAGEIEQLAHRARTGTGKS